jgi:hypothetical protein
MNRVAVTALVLFASGLWALVLAHNGWVIPISFFTPMSWVVGGLMGLLLVFDRWSWRWPGIRSLVGRPDLQGTWKGSIKPSAKTINHNARIEPVEVFVIVRQTFSTLHIRLLSPESQSFSLAATLVAEAPEQYTITWVFRNEPRLLVQDRSRVHLGGGFLRLGGEGRSMSGHYWTDRYTAGELDLVLLSRARAGDYESAGKINPQ